jgi:trehalose 6-phosphate synthase/phosphatase
LVVVSNRLSVTLHRGPKGLEYRRSTGGLVSALEPVLRSRGGTWVGWPGLDLRAGDRLPAGDGAYGILPVRLSESEIGRYYHGLCNRTLWPLFHSFPTRTRYDPREWETYERVNARFADVAMGATADAELVWVHDYQLMCAPWYLRQRAPAQRIAFFLHIPFPPYDVFRLLPWDREILRGLLACDVVGFHVESYARNFLDCVDRLLGMRLDRELMLIDAGERTVAVGAFPIGIDYELFASRARAAGRARATPGERIVLGADRLDYTKGIPERIRAFERLLERQPGYRGHVVLMQIAVPSRAQVAEYRDLKREIDELVGQVNGRFATATWSPIRYLYQDLPPERLAALYRDADVALVTPLRDGMNLVAKEFVASQVRSPGVLILSRLAGTAETMKEALLVNPCDIDGTAAALECALEMPPTERRARLEALQERERRFDVHQWAATFLAAALADRPGLQPPTAAQLDEWLETFLADHRLALFLDYDGTLTPICEHPSKAVLTPEMRGLVEACARRPDTDVTVVSGRSLADIRAMVDCAGLTYVGNHGLEIAAPDLAPFHHPDLAHYETAARALAQQLGAVALDGAWVETKGPTLTFHYRAVAEVQQTHLAARARAIIRDAGFQPRDAHAAVEARPPIGWDKGQAVLHLVRERYGPAWSSRVRVVYVGDDETDEDAFRALRGLGETFRVASPAKPTLASHRLHDVAGVQALLRWLAGRSPAEPSDGGARSPVRTGRRKRARWTGV